MNKTTNADRADVRSIARGWGYAVARDHIGNSFPAEKRGELVAYLDHLFANDRVDD